MKINLGITKTDFEKPGEEPFSDCLTNWPDRPELPVHGQQDHGDCAANLEAALGYSGCSGY